MNQEVTNQYYYLFSLFLPKFPELDPCSKWVVSQEKNKNLEVRENEREIASKNSLHN